MPVGLTSVVLAVALRDWKLTNAAMEMIGMPLARGPRSAFVALVNGVHFELRDDCLSRMISCSITRGALAELAGKPLAIAELEQVFQSHRDTIERIASHKYDAGNKTSGMVTVAPSDFSTTGRRNI